MLSNNAYVDSVNTRWEYIGANGTDEAAIIQLGNDGEFLVRTAPAGAADEEITWTTRMTVANDGIITKPAQPAFQAHLSGNQDDVAINGSVKVLFDTETFDVSADFNTTTNTFTAPVTGKYVLGFTLAVNAPDAAAGFYQFYLATSNRTYTQTNTIAGTTDPTYWTFTYSIVADMDAADTALVNLYQNVGSAQMDIRVESEFYGYLLG